MDADLDRLEKLYAADLAGWEDCGLSDDGRATVESVKALVEAYRERIRELEAQAVRLKTAIECMDVEQGEWEDDNPRAVP